MQLSDCSELFFTVNINHKYLSSNILENDSSKNDDTYIHLSILDV